LLFIELLRIYHVHIPVGRTIERRSDSRRFLAIIPGYKCSSSCRRINLRYLCLSPASYHQDRLLAARTSEINGLFCGNLSDSFRDIRVKYYVSIGRLSGYITRRWTENTATITHVIYHTINGTMSWKVSSRGDFCLFVNNNIRINNITRITLIIMIIKIIIIMSLL